MKPVTFQFDWCNIGINNQITLQAGISLDFTYKGDNEGNELPKSEQTTHFIELDNYQAYKLAMTILQTIDVKDTRGSN